MQFANFAEFFARGVNDIFTLAIKMAAPVIVIAIIFYLIARTMFL